jgi:hypothetical protein
LRSWQNFERDYENRAYCDEGGKQNAWTKPSDQTNPGFICATPGSITTFCKAGVSVGAAGFVDRNGTQCFCNSSVGTVRCNASIAATSCASCAPGALSNRSQGACRIAVLSSTGRNRLRCDLQVGSAPRMGLSAPPARLAPTARTSVPPAALRAARATTALKRGQLAAAHAGQGTSQPCPAQMRTAVAYPRAQRTATAARRDITTWRQTQAARSAAAGSQPIGLKCANFFTTSTWRRAPGIARRALVRLAASRNTAHSHPIRSHASRTPNCFAAQTITATLLATVTQV